MKIKTLFLSLLSLLVMGCKPISHTIDIHQTLVFILIAGIIGLFFVLTFRSNMLREEVNDQHAFQENHQAIYPLSEANLLQNRGKFSLAKVQLAIWTVIISCSYLYLQFAMGDCDTTNINQTALVLLGIAVGITATGKMIDNKEIRNKHSRHQNAPSEGFFTDLLSDGNGISIHRFQHVIWIGVAMTIYLYKIYQTRSGCQLPELSNTLLALTGISSATFTVIRAQENPAGTAPSPNPAQAAPVAPPSAPSPVMATTPT